MGLSVREHHLGSFGTATATSGAATLNNPTGQVTSESLTTAAGADYVLTITGRDITAKSVVLATAFSGTNTTIGLDIREVIPAAGSITIYVHNGHASSALNGTIVVSYCVVCF